jgi:hypothetical protein
MDELTDYPIVRELLAQLLQLTAEDSALPLHLLMNVHKGILRKPLELIAIYSFSNRGWTEVVEDTWPRVLIDHLGADAAVGRAYGRAHDVELALMEGAPDGLDEHVVWLIERCGELWQNYDPAVTLHQLTWPNKDRVALAALLEAELTRSPQSRVMLVDLASRSKAEVEANSW